MVTQSGAGVHLGRTHNDWHMRLANDVPMELKIEMGAGQGNLRLGSLLLTKLEVEMGAGQATVDLTGDWKKDLDGKIEGGVGTATIRLPKNVGVRVHAEGGIGSINVQGLRREGDAYVNDAYDKSPVTLRLNVSAVRFRPVQRGFRRGFAHSRARSRGEANWADWMAEGSVMSEPFLGASGGVAFTSAAHPATIVMRLFGGTVNFCHATRSSTSARVSGRLTCGQCPPPNSMGSTPSHSRAALRCHAGVIVRSSAQTI